MTYMHTLQVTKTFSNTLILLCERGENTIKISNKISALGLLRRSFPIIRLIDLKNSFQSNKMKYSCCDDELEYDDSRYYVNWQHHHNDYHTPIQQID